MPQLQELLTRKILLADGAMGTQLMRAGLPADKPGEWWNIAEPLLVAEIHGAYARAGSDLVLTNTFGGSPLKLAKAGLGERMREINLAAVKLARKAVGAGVLVAGDIGPTGEMLEPLGPAKPDQARENYAQQARTLAEGGVDLLFLETFFDLREALLALEGAVATGLPVIASLTFDWKNGKVATIAGDEAGACARALWAGGASAVGANCTLTIDGMVQTVRALRSGGEGPLVCQPNAGQPEVQDGRLIYRETPEHFAAVVPNLLDEGVRIIGGCCGTTPAFIGAARQAVDRYATGGVG